jgi:hypothetical protein
MRIRALVAILLATIIILPLMTNILCGLFASLCLAAVLYPLICLLTGRGSEYIDGEGYGDHNWP